MADEENMKINIKIEKREVDEDGVRRRRARW